MSVLPVRGLAFLLDEPVVLAVVMVVVAVGAAEGNSNLTAADEELLLKILGFVPDNIPGEDFEGDPKMLGRL